MFPMLLDRVVCILLFTALSTLALELTGLGPQALKDSKIYVIPIVTLSAVSDLVQSIALGFNTGGHNGRGGQRAVHGPMRHEHRRHAYYKSAPVKQTETAAAA